MTDSEEIAPSDDALPPEDLRYPEFDLGEGVDPDGGLDAERDLDREEMAAWLRDLADGLASHDVAFEGDEYRATFGVAPADVAVSFDPDEDHRGTIEFTVRLNARVMDVADADLPKVGARGGRGFIPLAMLTEGDDRTHHCYNWIDDPTAAGGEADHEGVDGGEADHDGVDGGRDHVDGRNDGDDAGHGG